MISPGFPPHVYQKSWPLTHIMRSHVDPDAIEGCQTGSPQVASNSVYGIISGTSYEDQRLRWNTGSWIPIIAAGWSAEVLQGSHGPRIILLGLNISFMHTSDNVPSTVLPVYGTPRLWPLGVSVYTKSSGIAKVLLCIAGKSAQKVGTIFPLSYRPLYPEAWPVTY